MAGCRQPSGLVNLEAGPGSESCPAQCACGDEDPSRAERRRGLLKRSCVHAAQRRHEPPCGGVPPWLARPRGQRPTVTPSKVLRECGKRSIDLVGLGERRLATKSLRRERRPGADKIMCV